MHKAATFILIMIWVGIEEILAKPARHLYRSVIAHGSMFKIFIAFYNWWLFLLLQVLHFHCKGEYTSFANTIWVDTYAASIDMHQLLGDLESQPYSLRIHIGWTSEFTEHLEFFFDLVWTDPLSIINDVNFQHF